MNRPMLTIINEKESEFEFDVSIQGVPAQEATVRFVVEGRSYDTTINCTRNANNKWLARIPNMRLDESAKNFRVEVIAGGYYFCPSQGAVKIVSSPRVQVAEMVQRKEPATVQVSATMSSVDIEPARSLVMMESMPPSSRDSVYKRCRAAAQIFARAGDLLAVPVAEQSKMTTHGMVDILEAVKKAVKMIEAKVYL